MFRPLVKTSLPPSKSRTNYSRSSSLKVNSIQKRALFQEVVSARVSQHPIPEEPVPKTIDSIVPQITAHHIMQSRPQGIISIPETKTVYEALKKMNENQVGCIVVERISGGFGIFTETDYLRKIALKGLSSKTTELIQVTNYNVVTVTPSTTLDQISSLMMQDGIHHLPVTEVVGEPNNRTIRPISVISSRDVTEHFVKAVTGSSDLILEGNVRQVFDRLGRQSSGDIWLSEDNTVFDAIMKMSEAKVGALLVNKKNTFTGIFTERDYLTKIILKGRSSKLTKLSDVITRNVQYIPSGASILDCLEIAVKGKFRHIPIVSELGNEINEEDMVGMITINDVISFLMLEVELKRLKKTSPDLM